MMLVQEIEASDPPFPPEWETPNVENPIESSKTWVAL